MKLKRWIVRKLAGALGLPGLELRLKESEAQIGKTKDLMADVQINSNTKIIVASRLNCSKGTDTVKIYDVHFESFAHLKDFMERLSYLEQRPEREWIDTYPPHRHRLRNL